MSGANGADIGQVVAMLQDVIAMQSDTRLEIAELRKEIRSVEVRHGARLDDLGGRLASLRQELAAYHSTVVGHGILISELDARASRIEAQLDLPPIK